MASLIQCVLTDVTPAGTSMTEEEVLATYDLDAVAISNVEGGWESVDVGDPADPHHPDLHDKDFEDEGPSVYERKGFMIVRGIRDSLPIWFVYESSTVGVH